jgi:hypothetical protein
LRPPEPVDIVLALRTVIARPNTYAGWIEQSKTQQTKCILFPLSIVLSNIILQIFAANDPRPSLNAYNYPHLTP